MINRRAFVAGAAAMSAVPALPAAAVEVGDNGLHVQSWFLDSFLDLGDDLAEAADGGKHLAVFFEQRGCPYCREMHEVNLQMPHVADYLQTNFSILQLDIYGSRGVTDFDGEEMEEREIARRWRINFTPTVVFFPMDRDAVAGMNGRDAEIARMPGYFKPAAYLAMFRYVHEGVYKDQTFQRYLKDNPRLLENDGASSG
ncbi:MAG: thioredoxin family protein [Minwuia sp.]|uniref:thioredoxin family protein n=1 Tax=Minwuia sp. TaxID=2493630 RepID=UPI003A83EAB6